MMKSIIMIVLFGGGIGFLISPAWNPELAPQNLAGFVLIGIGLFVSSMGKCKKGQLRDKG